MVTKRLVLIIPGPNTIVDFNRIRKGKSMTWPDEQYELSVEAMKVLKDLKDTYSHGNTKDRVMYEGCYCEELICNSWKDITDDMVLRSCSYCTKVVDIAIEYATGVKDIAYVKKRIFRFKRFDNFGKIKMIGLMQKFRTLFKRDQGRVIK